MPLIWRQYKKRKRLLLTSCWLGRFVIALTLTFVIASGMRAQKQDRHDDSPLLTAGVHNDPELDAGFHQLYELKFDAARERFTTWEHEHPEQPIGPALEAASSLFEQFYREGVLTSEFFLDDRRLLGGIKGDPDAVLEEQFASAARRARELARRHLQNQRLDPDALFALTLVEGMQADDLFLIQRRQLDSLHHLREADRNARVLLQIAPDTDDAYVALGAANYIIGCLPGYKRAMLWVGGVHGDKALGIEQLSRAASSISRMIRLRSSAFARDSSSCNPRPSRFRWKSRGGSSEARVLVTRRSQQPTR